MNTDDLVEMLKGLNTKVTPARLAILSVFETTDGHLSIDDIYLLAKKEVPNIGIATTYRTVKLLADAGLIEKHNFDGCDTLYEKKTLKDHNHIIDLETSEVHEFENDKIKKVINDIAKTMGYELVNYRLELYGKKKK